MIGAASKKYRYHNPYANLAAAILESGVRCDDTAFLESDWADNLREMCILDDEMYGHRNVKADKAVLHKPTSRRGSE